MLYKMTLYGNIYLWEQLFSTRKCGIQDAQNIVIAPKNLEIKLRRKISPQITVIQDGCWLVRPSKNVLLASNQFQSSHGHTVVEGLILKPCKMRRYLSSHSPMLLNGNHYKKQHVIVIMPLEIGEEPNERMPVSELALNHPYFSDQLSSIAYYLKLEN